MFNKSTKFLIVGNTATARKFIIKSLERLGFSSFIEAGSAKIAWDILSKENNEIEFIISNWNIPKFDGYELLQKIRASEKYKDLIFLMISAEGRFTRVKMVLDAGANGYLVKPFNTEGLQATLQSTWKRTKN